MDYTSVLASQLATKNERPMSEDEFYAFGEPKFISSLLSGTGKIGDWVSNIYVFFVIAPRQDDACPVKVG